MKTNRERAVKVKKQQRRAQMGDEEKILRRLLFRRINGQRKVGQR